MKDNKFFSFFEPVLKYIDTGKFFREPFRWLYAILAILNLLTPIVLLVMAINNDLFRYGGGRMIAAFILVWLVIAFVSWLGFQNWWSGAVLKSGGTAAKKYMQLRQRMTISSPFPYSRTSSRLSGNGRVCSSVSAEHCSP